MRECEQKILNNYIELLAGVGIIGTLAYYSIYIGLLIKLIKILIIK